MSMSGGCDAGRRPCDVTERGAGLRDQLSDEKRSMSPEDPDTMIRSWSVTTVSAVAYVNGFPGDFTPTTVTWCLVRTPDSVRFLPRIGRGGYILTRAKSSSN